MRRASGRRRGRLHILTASVADEDGGDPGDVVQPAVARDKARARDARPAARAAGTGSASPSSRTTSETRPKPRTSLPSTRRARSWRRSSCAAIAEAALAYARAAGDTLPAATRAAEGLPLRPDALAALHRPRSLDEAETARRRLALDELLVLQLALARRTAEREAATAAALPPPGELVAPLPRRAPVHAHPAAGAGDRRDRRRPRAHDADAAPAAGRRRLGQDRRRALRASARGRGGAPGRADGADRDARRAALSHHRGSVRAARRPGRPADERAARAGARERAPADRLRRRRDRGRHARADPAGGRVRRPRRRRRRRAAPLRRRAAQRARRGPLPARAAHDRDADSAHAGAHRLRRPRRERDRRAAREPQAGRHGLGRPRSAARRRTSACAGIWPTGGRPTSSAR